MIGIYTVAGELCMMALVHWSVADRFGISIF